MVADCIGVLQDVRVTTQRAPVAMEQLNSKLANTRVSIHVQSVPCTPPPKQRGGDDTTALTSEQRHKTVSPKQPHDSFTLLIIWHW